MPRTGGVERRAQFVATTQQLFYTKGYENTSIQDIIDAVGVSRGAFYHHFESKQAVLESVVDGLSEQIEAIIRPILDHPTHTALEKFDNMLQSLSSWKAGQREQVLGLLRVMNSDENLPLQHKLKAARMQFAIPAFTQIIEQGVVEGVFELRGVSAANSADFMFAIYNSVNQFIVALLLASDSPANAVTLAVGKFDAAQKTIEHMLSAPAGSLTIFDQPMLERWFATP